jgi:hypothetical protein
LAVEIDISLLPVQKHEFEVIHAKSESKPMAIDHVHTVGAISMPIRVCLQVLFSEGPLLRRRVAAHA